MSSRFEKLLLVAGLFCASACGEATPPESDVAIFELRGARIDGSEDSTQEQAQAGAAEGTSGALEPPSEIPGPPGDRPELVIPRVKGDPARNVALDPHAPRTIGHVRADGVRELAFLELSLAGLDPDDVVDSLLFPEDYPDGPVLPQAILDLDGEEIAVTGYMIPGRIEKGGRVRDFLLVRDLLACCFGGMPKPDEWIEVEMAPDHAAEYHRYVPLTVTGVLRVGHEIDAESLSPAIFKLTATDVRKRE